MAKSWLEVLEDAKTFPDTMNVPVAEGVSLTMGELRAIEKERRAKLDADAAILDRAAGAVAELYEKASKQPATPTTPAAPAPATPNPDTSLENDPMFGPILKQVSQQVKSLETTFQDRLSAEIKKTTEGLAKVYETDRMNSVFDSLSDRPQDLTLQKLADFALERGKRDRLGRLDLRAAYDDMRAPEREKQRLDAKFNEGIEQGKRQAAIDSAPKPRFTKPAEDNKAPRPGNVRDAMNAMRGDSKLMADLDEQIRGLQTGLH